MAKSPTGSILLLISAILTLIISSILFVISIIIAFIPISTEVAVPKWIIFGIFLLIALFGIMIGLFKIWVSNLMKDPKETKKAGIIALVVGIILGPDVLSIIGGIIAITDSEKNKKS